MLRLNLKAVRKSLENVRDHFDEINDQISVKRDTFDDYILENLMLAYQYLDECMDKKIDLFDDKHLNKLLELNHLILCGEDPEVRKEFSKHIERTKDMFKIGIKPILKWYRKHLPKNSALKVAAEIYVGVLSQPQLYFEGNHRTGSLIVSWILLNNDKPPFILSVDNAVAYFNPSSEIKFTQKRTVEGTLKLPKYKKSFKVFLADQVDENYIK